MAFIFQSKAVPIIAGLLMAVIQLFVGLGNIREAARLEREGIPHHSRSRGAAIWQNEILAFISMELFIALFSWPTALLFGAGYAFNSRLKSAQDAAIRERYLDKMDAEIERKYLKDTALGNQPPELAFLYHQIDPNLNPEVREKMAAALVDEPVTVVAQSPKKKKTAAMAQDQERVISETPPIPVDPKSVLGKMARLDRILGILRSKMTREKFIASWNFGLKIRRLFIPGLVILLGVIAVYALSHLFHSSRKASVAASVTPLQYQMPVPKINTASALPQSENQEPQPQAAAVVPAVVAQAPQTRIQIPTPPDLEQQRNLERTRTGDQIQSLLNAEGGKIAKFTSDCETVLASNTNRIADITRSYRSDLYRINNDVQKSVVNISGEQGEILKSLQDQFSNASADTKYDLKKFHTHPIAV